jgi:hypothetical protein
MAMGVAVLIVKGIMPVFDPYDPWSSSFGVKVKQRYYQGRLSGKIAAVGLGLMDWIAPTMTRTIFDSQPRIYPIVAAQEILRNSVANTTDDEVAEVMLALLQSVAVDPSGENGWAWGLGFSWMSKNGLYDADIPFVTHTPYVMEALLELAREESVREEAMIRFDSTWSFLQSLLIMYNGSDGLALSYAPINEPRIVVNANSYAAYAFALHALHGRKMFKDEARKKLGLLVSWVMHQQKEDGSWFYYADDEPGNFIDCFHTCFIIKNLLKVKTIHPKLEPIVSDPIEKGWRYLQNSFFDSTHGLCHRFVQRDIKDPFRWDLYDQAEYLGLLVDFGLFDEAAQFAAHVESIFKKGENWYCKIDMFGRRWGKNFMRWGIVPFFYHKARLEHELNMAVSACAA